MVSAVLTRGAGEASSRLASESLTGLNLRAEERNLVADVRAQAAEDPTIWRAQDILKDDIFTRGHSSRVAELSVALGVRLGLGRHALQTMWRAGEWHDTGKSGMRDLVYAPRQLTPEEMVIMRRHPVISAHLCEAYGLGNTVVQLARGHHSLGKKPYPADFVLQLGKEEDEVTYSQLVRQLAIIAIADQYDALRSARPYRVEIMSRDKALEIIRDDYIGPTAPMQALAELTSPNGSLETLPDLAHAA